MYRVIVIVLAFMLGVFIFFGADSAKTRGQKKWVNVIGTLLVWILAVLGAGVLVLCCLAAWDYWKTGDAGTAVSLGITAVILAVAIYVLLRSYFKKTEPGKQPRHRPAGPDLPVCPCPVRGGRGRGALPPGPQSELGRYGAELEKVQPKDRLHLFRYHGAYGLRLPRRWPSCPYRSYSSPAWTPSQRGHAWTARARRRPGCRCSAPP